MSALIMKRCVYIHAPKTGGTWALSTLRAQGIVVATLNSPTGNTHPDLATVKSVTDLPVITAVREPVSWLRSFWRFFRARDWRPATTGAHEVFKPLLAMASDDFQEFAHRYLHRRPGHIDAVQKRYAQGADYVCRQEHLSDDLLKALKGFNQEHVPSVLRDTPPQNISRKFEADLLPQTEKAIRETDHWVISEFYPELMP